MDVVKENFGEALTKICNLLPSSKFISIDEEMTGIFGVNDAERIQRDDAPAERYVRMKPVAQKYRIIQFGLCIFSENGFDECGRMQYASTAFNFFLFPEGDSGELCLSIGAIDFLKKNNLDFGKWFSSGIPYVRNSEIEHIKNRIYGATNVPASANVVTTQIVLSKDTDIAFMDRNLSKLKEMIECPDRHEYTFEGCNAYLRRYIYQTVEQLYPDTIVLSKAANVPNGICAKKVTLEMKEAHHRALMQQKDNMFNQALGFYHVYELLCKYDKPIVGHNCLFDLMFLYNWLQGPLPNEFNEFQLDISKLLKNVFDTKYIASQNISKWKCEGSIHSEDTSLQTCYDR